MVRFADRRNDGEKSKVAPPQKLENVNGLTFLSCALLVLRRIKVLQPNGDRLGAPSSMRVSASDRGR